MRIALLTRRFDARGGGTERDLMVTARCLTAARHEVAIYADEVRGTTDGWTVRRVGRGPRILRTLALIRFAYGAAAAARRDGAELVLSFARAIDADVLRSGGSAHSSYLAAARKWRSAFGAAAMRLSPYHRVQMLVERRAFASPRLRRTVAVSELVRSDLIRTFGLAPAQTATIYNGVDLEHFRPGNSADRAEVRQRYDLSTSAPLVLFVGNGFARKGLGFLIDALPAVTGAPHMLVAGTDRALESYRHRASRLQVGGRVTFAGRVPDVAPLFHAADVFALPSMFEPFGNVVMEAMASGLPTLTSAQSGVAELMPAALKPFVVDDPSDSGEVALRLSLLLDSAKDLRTAARAAAEEHPWDRYGRELLALLDAVASEMC
jgi:UDP-glucose:(heptosyl)LPS alpha-1,3-glucosyltransferase